jgi:iron complex transport system substrate-binding protein
MVAVVAGIVANFRASRMVLATDTRGYVLALCQRRARRESMTASQRIVSLLPSSTEILCALGLETSLVGLSHACDYPPQVASLPRLTAPSRNTLGERRGPNLEVHALARAGLHAYRLDLDLLRSLRPDLIVTQDQAAVCGVSPGDVLEATRRVLGAHIEVLSLQPTLLQDIWDDIYRLGEVTEQKQRAATLLEGLFARVNTVVAESIMLREPPSVAMLAWTDPLMLAGHWLPDLIQLAGGTDGVCIPGAPALAVEWARLQEYAPEVLVLSPCGYTLAQTWAALPMLPQLSGWYELPAVRQGHVYAVDGQVYFHRPGPRIVDSLEMLASLIHPDLFEEFLPHAGQFYCRVAT